MAKGMDDDVWFKEGGLPWWGPLAKRLLQAHEIPRHVAFVMDGNRRYARRHNLASVIEGHARGFEQMTKILDWCRELGVIEVTVYAFSIENFKRDKSEVEGLMRMAETKFEKLLSEEGFVNVCLAYTSQNEIARAMEWIRQGVQRKLITENDIDAQLIAGCLDSRHSNSVDMLIRTSGERRLSDFLLWQCSNCYIHFEDILWPEMTFWHLFKAIIGYQRSRAFGSRIEKALESANSRGQKSKIDQKNVEAFLDWMNEECFKSRTQALLLQDVEKSEELNRLSTKVV